MVVQHNISAMTANRYYGVNNKGLASSLEKLASGYAINKAGDNAAGLAVSEKMRAQIGGLTQASKNAEDGISMVQTFEGALQETDSILQRMRTLAVQSANGSYQDDVDREAMQLEFDQLNDELNQIADTDFNGVVMLNGGQMADGLKAVAGKFDYANATRDAKELGKADINTLDNNKITKAAADSAWKEWSTGIGAYDRTKGDDYNPGPDSVNITFEYQGDGKWKATDVDDGGMDLDKINAGITMGKDGGTGAAGANNGGFVLSDKTGGSEIANVVLDTKDLVVGDKITLTVNNPAASNSNSENFAIANDGIADNRTAKKTADMSGVTFKLPETADVESTNGTGTTDMTAETKALLDAMNGAELTVTYNNGAVAADGVKVKLAGENKAATGSATGANLTVEGKTVGKLKVTAGAAGGAAKVEFQDKDGHTLAEFTAVAGQTGDTGDVKYTLANDASSFTNSNFANVSVKEPVNGSVSKSNAYEQSKATMTYTDHLSLQVGARTKDQVDFTFKYDSNGLGDLKANMNCSARTDGLGTADLSIADQKSANAAIDKIDNAINKISMVRATFGAAQNRLEHKINNIDTNTENLTAAESRIRDTQMDKEMMKFTSAQILSQASQSMLAQANSLPQGVLQLLG